MSRFESWSTKFRSWSSLAPLLATLAAGVGLGVSCTPDAGGDCVPGTANCQCAGGNQCYPGFECLAGYCILAGGGETGDPGDGDGDNPCDGGQSFCGGKCVDTQTNILHCGDCGVACAGDELCHEGACVTDCSEAPCEGLTYCDADTSLCLPGCEYDEQCGANEVCDFGTHDCVCDFDSVPCGDECIWEGEPCADNCGNGVIDPGEACDGSNVDSYDCADFGFTGGTLGCLGDCSDFDTSSCSNGECGNGIVEDGEDCDGLDLQGEDCMSQGFLGGTLMCSGSCLFDTSGCNNNADDGDCCYSNGSPGCEVPSVEACVCGLDPYCCDTTWDATCASEAINDCGATCP